MFSVQPHPHAGEVIQETIWPTENLIELQFCGAVIARHGAPQLPQNNRFYRVFEELAAVGIDAEPAVYDEDIEDEVRRQLLAVDGVLVWVDPIHQGKNRDRPRCDAA